MPIYNTENYSHDPARIKIIRGKHADQVERDFAAFANDHRINGVQTHYDAGEIVVIVFYEVSE